MLQEIIIRELPDVFAETAAKFDQLGCYIDLCVSCNKTMRYSFTPVEEFICVECDNLMEFKDAA